MRQSLSISHKFTVVGNYNLYFLQIFTSVGELSPIPQNFLFEVKQAAALQEEEAIHNHLPKQTSNGKL